MIPLVLYLVVVSELSRSLLLQHAVYRLRQVRHVALRVHDLEANVDEAPHERHPVLEEIEEELELTLKSR